MWRGKKVLFLLTVALLPICAWAQVAARVAGLESNPKYMALLLQEKQLHHSEDSIVNVISETRKLFATATTQREQYGKQILKLEGELFDIRNRVGEVVGAISAIEQEYVVTHMDAQPGTPAVALSPAPALQEAVKNQKPNLVYNDYFKANLAPSDYASLCRSQERETELPALLTTYRDNYGQMEALASAYSTAARPEAEEAYAKLLTLKGINAALADSISQVWSYIYDNKIFAYNYLLDKMNKNELLSDFEKQFRETNQLIASARDKMASPTVYGYPLRKKLILSYEVALADLLGYTQAHDSLAKVLKAVDALSYNLPPVDPKPRNFIEYGNIEVTPGRYNASHPIPQNEIFKYGTVYKIQVGSFLRQQPVSLFRNVSPLSYEKTEDGRYRYFAGAFREQAEAQAATAQLTKLGFRKPVLVVWRDGVFESLGEMSSDSGSGATKEVAGIYYRVEIVGEGEEISAAAKEVIDSVAQDKEVSRATDPEGNYIYTVGSFDEREPADRLVELLGTVKGVTAKVIELKN